MMGRLFDTGQLQELIDGQEFHQADGGLRLQERCCQEVSESGGIITNIKQSKPDIEPEHIRKRM